MTSKSHDDAFNPFLKYIAILPFLYHMLFIYLQMYIFKTITKQIKIIIF